MSDVILRAENVTQRFGGLVAVNDVDFELRKGEIVGIIGPNGAGKTTFFNDITGVYTPTAGKIYFKDTEITGKKPFEITSLGMARTFQNIRLFYRMTVLENVMVGMHTRTNANLIDCVLRTPKHKQTEKAAEEGAAEKERPVQKIRFPAEHGGFYPYLSAQAAESASHQQLSDRRGVPLSPQTQ